MFYPGCDYLFISVNVCTLYVGAKRVQDVCQGTRGSMHIRGQGALCMSGDKGHIVCQKTMGTLYVGGQGALCMSGEIISTYQCWMFFFVKHYYDCTDIFVGYDGTPGGPGDKGNTPRFGKSLYLTNSLDQYVSISIRLIY